MKSNAPTTAAREKARTATRPSKAKNRTDAGCSWWSVVGTLLPSQGVGMGSIPGWELRACMLRGAARKKVLMLCEAIEGWGLCGTVPGNEEVLTYPLSAQGNGQAHKHLLSRSSQNEVWQEQEEKRPRRLAMVLGSTYSISHNPLSIQALEIMLILRQAGPVLGILHTFTYVILTISLSGGSSYPHFMSHREKMPPAENQRSGAGREPSRLAPETML